MVAGGQRAGKGGEELFDVLVTAFAGGAARSLQGLRDVFGLEGAAAQRLLASVPVVVKHAAAANEAQNYLQLLRGIGAEVQLSRVPLPVAAAAGGAEPALASRRGAEPPPLPRIAPPPLPRIALPPTAAAQIRRPPPLPPSARAEPYQLPRPVAPAVAQDLEFDLGAASGEPDSALVVAREARAHQVGADDRPPPFGKAGRALRMPFGFDGAAESERLELAVEPRFAGIQPGSVGHVRPPDEAARSLPTRRSIGAVARRTGSGPSRAAAETARAESAADLPAAEAPVARAGVVDQIGSRKLARDPRQRSRALWRVLSALSIAAIGIWFDNSIAFGNANWFGVFAHAVAIYQLGLGLRGLTPW